MSRYFRKVGGFTDCTSHLKVTETEEVYVVHRNGDKHLSEYYNLKRCLNYVDIGIWEEIDVRLDLGKVLP